MFSYAPGASIGLVIVRYLNTYIQMIQQYATLSFLFTACDSSGVSPIVFNEADTTGVYPRVAF